MALPYFTDFLESTRANRSPVWMMRQAGRYLLSYQEIRKQHSFWEMVTNPALAAEVTLLPFTVLDVDAAILFSDILTLPYGLGIPIEMVEKKGPQVESPLLSLKDYQMFASYSPEKHTWFVADALSRIREKLSPDVAMIGFSGAPFTVACYLSEEKREKGKGGYLKKWLYESEITWKKAMETFAEATARYLISQIEAGCDVGLSRQGQV